MSHLSETTRGDSVDRLRRAADLLADGREIDAGKLILEGLKPVARDLKRTYGPVVKIIVKGWIRGVFDD